MQTAKALRYASYLLTQLDTLLKQSGIIALIRGTVLPGITFLKFYECVHNVVYLNNAHLSTRRHLLNTLRATVLVFLCSYIAF